MSDVFIAHVDEDADITLELALCLEEAGFTTWCYEVDSLPGPSYLVQTGRAVDQAKAVILVISPHSLNSRQVTKEVVRAHESAKEFIPVRHGITHIEFQTRQPEWREAIGAAASIAIPEDGVPSIIPRIVNGLKTLGIHPAPKADAARIRQIRKAFAEVQKGGTVPKAQPPVPVKEPEPEAVAVKPPRPKTARRIGRPKRWKKIIIIAAAVIVLGIVIAIIVGSLKSCPSSAPPASPTPKASSTPSPTSIFSGVVVFPDENLRATINYALNKPSDHQLTIAEAAVLKELNAVDKGITNLTGIEYCVNLEHLFLSGNKIQDITPLLSLTKLSMLDLKGNLGISDISALSSLTNLSELSLEYNKISDITPLSSLTNLIVLKLSYNGVSDLSALSSLTNLDKLYLGNNNISYVTPLSSLTRLDELYLSHNQIGDISPLSSLINLGKLMLDSNKIIDIHPLSSLTKLGGLWLAQNYITEVSALSALTGLEHLELTTNQITDIQPLVSNAGLSQGDTVILQDNPLTTTSVNVYIAQLKARGVNVEWSNP